AVVAICQRQGSTIGGDNARAPSASSRTSSNEALVPLSTLKIILPLYNGVGATSETTVQRYSQRRLPGCWTRAKGSHAVCPRFPGFRNSNPIFAPGPSARTQAVSL